MNKISLKKLLLLLNIIIIFIILSLFILGKINRTGYISEFQLNESLSSQNNYAYNFRIKYYSKIFRNSDIYNVYANIDKFIQDNNFIKNIVFDKKGSPFGTLISSQELTTNLDIQYNLELKTYILYILFAIIVISTIYSILLFKDLIFKHRKIIVFIYSIMFILITILIIISSIILNKKYITTNINNINMLNYSEYGYVYKAKLNIDDNLLFKIRKNTIILNNINYKFGYNTIITNKPLMSFLSTNIYYSSSNTFIINNQYGHENLYKYDMQIPTYIDDQYKITIIATKIPNNKNIYWHLNSQNYFKEIKDKYISNDYIVLKDIRKINSLSGGDPNLYLQFPEGITEISSITIENINNKLNINNNEFIFTSKEPLKTVNISYKVYINNFSTSILLLTLLLILITMLIVVKIEDYINIVYGLFVFILLLIINYFSMKNGIPDRIIPNFIIDCYIFLCFFISIMYFERKTSFFRNLYKDINDFVIKDKVYLIILLLSTIFIYAFKVLNFTKDLDDSPYIWGIVSSMLIQQSRPGSFLFRLLYDWDIFIPYWTDTLGVIILMIAVSMWTLYLQKLSYNKLQSVKYLFPIIFISVPLLCSIFLVEILRVSIVLLMVAISLLVMDNITKKFDIFGAIFLCFLLSIGVSIFESAIHFFVIGIFIAQFFYIYNGNTYDNYNSVIKLKKYIYSLFIAGSISLFSLILKKIYSVILQTLNELPKGNYVEQFFNWDQNNIFKNIINILFPIQVLQTYDLIFPFIIIIICSVFLFYKTKNILFLINCIFLLYSSIAINVVTGGSLLYQRAVVGMASFISFAYILPILIFYKNKYIKILFCILGVFIFLNNSKEVNDIYQRNYLRYERDKDTALNIAHRIILNDGRINTKPVFFIGISDDYNYSDLTSSKDYTVGRSEYFWTSYLKLYNRMTNSFSILGYPIVPINDKILEYEALYNSFYMNSFPKEGSVEAFDNYNIVKFGDDAGRLPFHFYNMNDMTANVITNNNFSINIKSKYNSLNIINAFINIDNAKNSILSINIYDDEENNIYYKQIDLSDINYTKAGFISIKLENLDIKIGSNYKIEFSLKPSNVDEFITTRLNQEGNIIMAVY